MVCGRREDICDSTFYCLTYHHAFLPGTCFVPALHTLPSPSQHKHARRYSLLWLVQVGQGQTGQ